MKKLLSDNFETRFINFFHLSIILKISKKSNFKKKSQEIFDNIFQNIEYHMRELGHGDVSVNKNMKNLIKYFTIFYIILTKIPQKRKCLKIYLINIFFKR